MNLANVEERHAGWITYLDVLMICLSFVVSMYFPTQIEEVLLQIEEIGPHYEILVERKNRLDVMTISVELIDDRLLDSYAKLSELEQRIKSKLKSALGLASNIKLVAPHTLQRFEGKAKRVTDLRKDGL